MKNMSIEGAITYCVMGYAVICEDGKAVSIKKEESQSSGN